MTEPIRLHSDTWSRIDVCYLSEIDFVNDDVYDVAVQLQNELSFTFAHDMDIENSFYNFKQFFLTDLDHLQEYGTHRMEMTSMPKNIG